MYSDMLFYGLVLEGGASQTIDIDQTVDRCTYIHIQNAAIDPKNYNGPSTVCLNVNGTEYVLCTLSKETQMQYHLDIVLDSSATFSISGKTNVHLTGFRSFSMNPEMDGDEEDEDEEDEEDEDEDEDEDEEDEDNDDEDVPEGVPLKDVEKFKTAKAKALKQIKGQIAKMVGGQEGEEEGEEEDGSDDYNDLNSDDYVGRADDDDDDNGELAEDEDEEEEGEDDGDEDEEEEEEEPKPRGKVTAPLKRGTLSTPAPPQKKARIQDSKPAPASAPSKMQQQKQQSSGESFVNILVAAISKQPSKTVKLGQLGTMVKKPDGVGKLMPFLKANSKVFKVDDKAQTVTLV
ncbi:hypothetical protein CEUSTIGMA_g3529.t1 [Chlamydomonas eustigma]|uniref:Nucleoplasmin-like domain-containing protein n=1 Tax=Chlamydomonas eustigma TaxID=1157962 RepID=A0A250WZ78_9CHLO|nr:hypothetical protein CEUSTIGMA_g3529.t1 [Chlamydomonas eustigma]|eukprot:GAX76086.1 hypothetical protein CEUSTIGMA_g3529.t1 [Chlamydomonas eustigma]